MGGTYLDVIVFNVLIVVLNRVLFRDLTFRTIINKLFNE